MTVELHAWRIEPEARFVFQLDDVALRALLDLFDQPLSLVERQAALLEVLSSRTPKPARASALSAHVQQALMEAEERNT